MHVVYILSESSKQNRLSTNEAISTASACSNPAPTHIFFNYLGDDVNVSSKLLFLLFTEILWVIAPITATFCMHYVIIFLPEEGRGKPIQW